jgi:hypothetical protein
MKLPPLPKVDLFKTQDHLIEFLLKNISMEQWNIPLTKPVMNKIIQALGNSLAA